MEHPERMRTLARLPLDDSTRREGEEDSRGNRLAGDTRECEAVQLYVEWGGFSEVLKD